MLGSFFFFFFSFFFFFPPNLVSIETRLAEGEIKQPHVTQIPTLKNLPVALAGALHNKESARAPEGTWCSTGGPPGSWQQCHRLSPGATETPPLALGSLHHTQHSNVPPSPLVSPEDTEPPPRPRFVVHFCQV